MFFQALLVEIQVVFDALLFFKQIPHRVFLFLVFFASKEERIFDSYLGEYELMVQSLIHLERA